MGVQTQVAHGGLDDRTGRVAGRDPQGAGGQGLATRMRLAFLPVDSNARLQQTVGQDVAVDRGVIDQPASAARALDLAGRRSHDVGDALGRSLEAVEDAVELDPHLQRQRIAGGVIGQGGRTARILQVVRVVLRLEHVQHVRAIGLGRLHHIGTCRIGLAADGEGARGAIHVHARLDQAVEEGDGVGQVGLIGRDDIAARIATRRIAQHLVIEGRIDAATAGVLARRLDQSLDAGRRDAPGVGIALVDGVLAHAPDVEQQPVLVARGVVQHGAVDRLRVLDRLGEMPGLGRDRHGQVVAGQLVLRDQADLARRRVAGDLGQQADGVVEVGDGALHPVVPGRIAGAAAHGRAGLALFDQAAVHGRADFRQGAHDQRVVVVVKRVAEGRHEDHRPGGRRLVVVVDDLREPLAEELAVDVGRLGHGRQVVVAVVIVADVLLVQDRDRGELALQRVRVAHVPVGDQLHPVRVQRREQDDGVIQNAQGLGVLGGQPFMHGGDQGLGRDGLGRVQTAVDPDHGLALGGHGAGFVFGDAFSLGEATRDLLIAVQVGQVLRRRDDGDILGAALGGLADLDQLHPVRLAGQGLQIGFPLGVVDQVIVGPDVEPEGFAWRGDVRPGRRGGYGDRLLGQRRLIGQSAGAGQGQGGETHRKSSGERGLDHSVPAYGFTGCAGRQGRRLYDAADGADVHA
ncbi:hypothetical protein D3C85_565210 [compost metagenome]